jgi:hypothetical protein
MSFSSLHNELTYHKLCQHDNGAAAIILGVAVPKRPHKQSLDDDGKVVAVCENGADLSVPPSQVLAHEVHERLVRPLGVQVHLGTEEKVKVQTDVAASAT